MCKCKLKSSPIFSKFTRTVDKIDFAKLFFADSRYKYKLLAFLMILKLPNCQNFDILFILCNNKKTLESSLVNSVYTICKRNKKD